MTGPLGDRERYVSMFQLTEKDAYEKLSQYASRLRIELLKTTSVKHWHDGWWIFRSFDWIEFGIDSNLGKIDATIGKHGAKIFVESFQLTPDDPASEPLPLWVTYPNVLSVSTFWRYEPAQSYKFNWHDWWITLTNDQKLDYRKRYPEPNDDFWGWSGFYDKIADVPGDPDSIGDLIIGRVPPLDT